MYIPHPLNGANYGRQNATLFGSPSSSRAHHNAVVTAMLSSNTLQDCHQVDAMFTQCQSSDDNQSRICETARNYFRRCHATADDFK
jgi:hypothetical protein